MALYADIVEIVAPAKASPGQMVDITIRIKNLYNAPISIMVGGALEYGVLPYPEITLPVQWGTVSAGVTHSFTGSFIMPNKDVVIHAYSYYWAVDQWGSGAWYYDDHETKKVSCEVIYAFTISQPAARAI